MEVHIPMTAYGISSSGSATNYERTKINLNTDDFDATATYFFEVYATNSEATPRSVQIVNSGGGGTGGVIALDASTLSPKRYRVSLTPSVGNDDYRVRLLASGGGQGVLDARIVVVLPDKPTKAAFYIPLVNSTDGATTSSDTGATVDTTTSTSYTQAVPSEYPYWYKDLTQIDGAVGTVTLACNISSSSAANTATFGLHDSSGTLATGAECSTSATAITLVNTTVTWSNLADTTAFEGKIKTNGATCNLYNAMLIIRMTSINKMAYPIRMTRQISQNFTDNPRDNNRVLYTAANFKNSTFYYEATGKDDSLGTATTGMFDAGATDTGTSGSTLSGSTIDYSSTSKQRQRTSALTLTDGNSYLHGHVVTSGSINTFAGFLIVFYERPAQGGTLTLLGVG